MKTTPPPIALICVVLGALTGIAQDLPGRVEVSTPQTPPAVNAPANYRLSPGDLIYVKVYQEDDLTASLRVSEDGTIPFPLIGSIKVGGLTVTQAAAAVCRPLEARYLVNPQISVTVLSFTERYVTILGQVTRAGTYNLKEQSSVDLLEAIGLAGGFTRLADTRDVTVRRVVNRQTRIFTVDAKQIALSGKSTDVEILPGDTITVPERMF